MMKSRFHILASILMLALAGSAAWADQILLKSGEKYSGKFIRGDSEFVEFRILGDIQKFRTSEVAQIVFEEPELVNPPTGRQVVTPQPPAVPPTRDQNPPAERTMSSQPSDPTAAVTDPTLPSVTLPKGTPIRVRTVDAIDTDRNRVGDAFQAILEEPLAIGSQIIAPKGADVTGKIAYAEESGLRGQSVLILELREIDINGRSYPILTSDYSDVGESQGKKTAGTIGGGAAIGAVIGAIAGGGKGAAIGAATGAAVGTGVRVLTRGETLKVPPETLLEFKLQRPLTVEIP